MKRCVFFISISMLLLALLPAEAQDKSNRGKEFWLGYGYCWTFDFEPPTNTQDLVLYLSTDAPARVTVSVTNTTWSQTVNIPANTVNAAVIIPKSGVADARMFTEGTFDRAIHIVSDTPIVAYAHVYNTQVSGATMLMPAETFGYKYFSLNYSQSQSGSKPPNPPATFTQNGPSWYAWFYVIATENNTRLEITPSDTTRNGWLPGQTYTVNLNKGQIYNVMGKLGSGSSLNAASKDLTGSKVLSVPGADGKCHPIALFSGSSGIRLCYGDGGEVMQQQVFPAQAWGTRYLTYHTLNNTSTNINDPFKNFYRILVDDPSTVVKRNGTIMTGIINNRYYEYLDSTGGDYIEADKPVLMAQYTPGGNRCHMLSSTAYGDPEMWYLSPLEQGKKDVLFYATRNRFIDYNYINVIVPTAGLASLRLNGNPFNPVNTKAHPNLPGYSVAVARLTGAAAQHRITCDSVFNGTVYGLGLFESYGYNIGTFIKNLNNYSSLENTLKTTPATDTFTCTNTPVKLFAKLAFPATSITWQLSGIPGVTPGNDTTLNNPVPVRTEEINKRTYYVYSLNRDFVFTQPGKYVIPVTYSAAVIENCAQTEFAEIEVEVRPGPVADFEVGGQGCAIDTVFFTGTSDKKGFNINRYRWDFSDNTTQTTENAAKKFANNDPQVITYTLIADNGCTHDTTKTIPLNSKPAAAFGILGSTCVGDSIRVSDSTTIGVGSISTLWWSFGDGRTITTTNANPVAHRYAAAGTYTVRLVTVSDKGCISDTVLRTVQISTKPVSKFGISNAACLGDSIRFTDSSSVASGSIIRWNWNLGDGNTRTNSSNNPFLYAYTAQGTYTTSLVVQSSIGCSDTSSRSITVNPKPLAAFAAAASVCQNKDLVFTDNSTPSGSLTSRNWHFGDGNTVTTTNANPVTHRYATAGTFTAFLVVTGTGGCKSDTVFRTITVAPTPVARFGFDRNNCINAADSVLIVDTSSISSGTITSWYWNFGDGNSRTNTNGTPFRYKFAGTGNYNVQLAVQSANGCVSDTLTKTLVVSVKPVAAFTISKTEACAGDSLTFTDNSTLTPGTISNWQWNFGDGTVVNRTNNAAFLYAYTQPGTYTVSLAAVSAGNCASEPVTRTVFIREKPMAGFLFDRNICIGDSIRFTDQSQLNNGTISAYSWNFGNGVTQVNTSNQPIYYRYPATGTYTVRLSVASSLGCVSDTISRQVVVAALPSAIFTVSGLPCADSSFTFTSSTPFNNTVPTTWYWNTSEGFTTTSTTSPVFVRSFAPAATGYTIRHAVSTGPGCNSDTVVVTVPAIRPNPIASFTITGDTLCVNKPLVLNASDPGTIRQWNWNLGSGSSNQRPPFTHSYTTAGTYTITLAVIDTAGCGSALATRTVQISPAPDLDAGPDFFINPGGTVVIRGSLSNAADYQINWSPPSGLNNTSILNPLASPDSTTRYTIRVVNRTSLCTAIDNVTVAVISKLFIPNAFTPNGDGVNDVWRIPGLELYPDAEVIVYNRWGQQIIRSRNYNTRPWDGTIKGVSQPPGLFTYLIILNNDKKETVKGSFTLIR